MNRAAQHLPRAEEQRCWNHRVVNLLMHVRKQRQGEARELLTKIPYQGQRAPATAEEAGVSELVYWQISCHLFSSSEMLSTSIR